jgi:hypothetical protein
LDVSGETKRSGNITLSSLGHTDFSFSVTILHEYIHSASNRHLIRGDKTKNGYANLTINGKAIPLTEQINALDVARQAAKPGLIPVFDALYTDQGYIKNGKDVKVKGGYLFEVLGFGTVTHQPAKAK